MRNFLRKCKCGADIGTGNALGKCRQCYNKDIRENTVNENERRDNFIKNNPVYKHLTCPACKKRVDQLLKIKEFSLVICLDCAQKYRNMNITTKPTEEPQKERVNMIVGRVSLARNNRIPTNEITKRHDGERLLFHELNQKNKDDEFTNKLEEINPGVKEVTLEELNDDEYEKTPDQQMESVNMSSEQESVTPEIPENISERKTTGKGIPKKTKVSTKGKKKKGNI